MPELKDKLRTNCWDKIWYVAEGFRRKLSTEELFGLTRIDPWFLNNINDIVKFENTRRYLRRRIRGDHALPLFHIRDRVRSQSHR